MNIWDLVVAFILPLLTTEVLKKALGKLLELAKGQIVNLPHGVKLVLGLLSGLFFTIMMQTGFAPELIPLINPISTILVTLAAKALYDLAHDLKAKK